MASFADRDSINAVIVAAVYYLNYMMMNARPLRTYPTEKASSGVFTLPPFLVWDVVRDFYLAESEEFVDFYPLISETVLGFKFFADFVINFKSPLRPFILSPIFNSSLKRAPRQT